MKLLLCEVSAHEQDFFKQHLHGMDSVMQSQPLTKEDAAAHADIDILCIFIYSRIDRKILDQLPHLKLIVTRSTGYNHIDLDACKERGISVQNLPTYATVAVAEYTFAVMLSLVRHICSASDTRGMELHNARLGIIGTGRIGKHVARIAYGFGMRVCAFDVCEDQECATRYDVEYCSLHSLLCQSDIITIHVPLLPDTRHMINKDAIERMKPGVILINTARGEVVDTDALAQGLHDGIIGGAALDVVEQPVPPSMLNNPNVIITPHNAYNTIQSHTRMLQETVDIINAYDKYINS